jgi:hypothetical protein
MVEYLKARHILCHFHHQQRVTAWLKRHFQDKDEIAASGTQQKPKMENSYVKSQGQNDVV